MNIEDAFKIYFKKQYDYWQSSYGSSPRIPFNKSIDKHMIIPDSLNNGYIQWQPLRQEVSIDLSDLEQRFNFSIHAKIRQYFTSYWFLSLDGAIGNITLDFCSIPYGIDIPKLIEECYTIGAKNSPSGSTYFAFGYASVDGDDSYLIFVDNKTADVLCVQLEDDIVIELCSLEKVISEMDVVM